MSVSALNEDALYWERIIKLTAQNVGSELGLFGRVADGRKESIALDLAMVRKSHHRLAEAHA